MIEQIIDKQLWDEYVLGQGGHPLQLWGWGELKARHNWQAERIVVKYDESVVGGAQLLIRPLPKPFNSLIYLPRGPFGDSGAVLEAIPAYVKKQYRPTHLIVEPDSEQPVTKKGWRKSPNSILLARTIQIDLTEPNDDILAAMTKKTRQYIRKSANDGVVVKPVKTDEGIAKCLEIYKQTAARAKFALHNDAYYYDLHKTMGDSSVIFGAYYGEELIAFIWLIVSAHTAFELYGGMSDKGQAMRANYTLKWHAITKCKEWGIAIYDVNGLLNDGVSTFKQGFASHETQLSGSFDYPLSPLYPAWTKALPTLKKVMRSVKKR